MLRLTIVLLQRDEERCGSFCIEMSGFSGCKSRTSEICKFVIGVPISEWKWDHITMELPRSSNIKAWIWCYFGYCRQIDQVCSFFQWSDRLSRLYIREIIILRCLSSLRGILGSVLSFGRVNRRLWVHSLVWVRYFNHRLMNNQNKLFRLLGICFVFGFQR